MLAFLIAGILPILVMQEVSFYLNTRHMTKKVDVMAKSNLIQIAERTDLTMEIYTNLINQIYTDDEIIRIIDDLQSDVPTGKAIAYNKMYNRLKQYNILGKGVRCISVVCRDGTSVTYDFETGSSLDNLWIGIKDMRETKPYQNANKKIGIQVTPTMEIKDHGESRYMFCLSKQIFDFSDLEKGTIATAIITVDALVLEEICKIETENEITFILDEDKHVIYYPEEMFMGIQLDEKVDELKLVELSRLLRNKTKVINKYKDDKTEWEFYYVYAKEYMLKDVYELQRTILIVGIFIVISAILLIAYTVRKVHQSVHVVIEGMKEVKQGNLSVEVPVNSQDEIGQIAQNFNEMTREVRRLVEEVKEAGEKQKNAEIRALEAQINPHFLYNTLDSINWIAIEKGEYEISKMLRNLGVILRYSVNKSNKLATVHEIADWLEKYISLQKIRFNDAFDFKLNIDERTYGVKLYKLLLQPFIENAIVHGFNGEEQGGIITIDIMFTKEENKICIIIEDNGIGMPKETAEQYNNRQKVLKRDEESIGLSNSFSRMHMYYGEEAEWNVSSLEGMGTVITLRLPVE